MFNNMAQNAHCAVSAQSNFEPNIEMLSEFETVHAVTDESELPPLPPDQIEGVLPVGGKMVVQAAMKNWKTWLMVQLAVCVAAGEKWLGLNCAQGKVLYVNLELSAPRFMKRQYAVTKALGADPALVKENLVIKNGLESGASIEKLVNTLLMKQEGEGYSLVIIDPMYKIFDGCENEQLAVARFFGEIDRLRRGLGCSVAVVHHHSKGFKGTTDIADRSSGSGVIGRDVDAMVDLCRIDGPGKAMRASFVLREYEDKDPVDYWFDYPLCIPDKEGALAKCRPMSAHGGIGTTNQANAAAKLAEIEEACRDLLEDVGEAKCARVADAVDMKSETVKKWLEKSQAFDLEKRGAAWYAVPK